MVPELTIAVAKGRLQDEALALLAAVGAGVSIRDRSSRRLGLEVVSVR
jgi:ATP phosphoribosyltransferase